MKKVLLSFILLSLFSLTANAQSPLGKGGKQINLGVGFSSFGIPVYGGMDFGVHEDITMGFQLEYQKFDEDFSGAKFDHQIYSISVNGNYHFNSILDIPQKWDLYAGANIGYWRWSSPDNYPGDHASGLGLGLQIGGRYYFTNSLGLHLELGGGNAVSGGKIGLSIKL
jgi:hypothetical protein